MFGRVPSVLFSSACQEAEEVPSSPDAFSVLGKYLLQKTMEVLLATSWNCFVLFKQPLDFFYLPERLGLFPRGIFCF